MENKTYKPLTVTEFEEKRKQETLTAQDIMNMPPLDLCVMSYIDFNKYCECLKENGEFKSEELAKKEVEERGNELQGVIPLEDWDAEYSISFNSRLYKRAESIVKNGKALESWASNESRSENYLFIYENDIFQRSARYDDAIETPVGYYIPSEKCLMGFDGKETSVLNFQRDFSAGNSVISTPDETILCMGTETLQFPADTKFVLYQKYCFDVDNETIYNCPHSHNISSGKIEKVDLNNFLPDYYKMVFECGYFPGSRHFLPDHYGKDVEDELFKKMKDEPFIDNFHLKVYNREQNNIRSFDLDHNYTLVANLDACKYENGIFYLPCPDNYKGFMIGKGGSHIAELEDHLREPAFACTEEFKDLKKIVVVNADHVFDARKEKDLLISEIIGRNYPFSWTELRFEAFKNQHPELGNITMDDEGYVFKMDENGNITDPENPIALYDSDTREFTGYDGPSDPENDLDPEQELDTTEYEEPTEN